MSVVQKCVKKTCDLVSVLQWWQQRIAKGSEQQRHRHRQQAPNSIPSLCRLPRDGDTLPRI